MAHAIITDSDFRRQTRAPVAGKYLLFGDEDYLKVNAVEAARRLLCPDESMAPFNCISIDCAAYSADELRRALLPPPMFTACKAVTVTLTFDDLRQSEITELTEVLGDEVLFEHNFLTIVVPAGGIDAGTPKRPSALLKKLSEVIVPVRFDPVSGGRLREWINRHYTAAGVVASPAVCDITSARCGESMFTLASEIDKVAFYVLADGREEVTEGDVRLVACESGGYDAFAFANAILNCKCAEALAVLAEMKAKRIDPIIVMSELIRVVCDMSAVDHCLAAGMSPAAISAETGLREYPVKLYSAAVRRLPAGSLAALLDAAARADAALKSSALDYLPIERLICSMG